MDPSTADGETEPRSFLKDPETTKNGRGRVKCQGGMATYSRRYVSLY